MGILSALKSLFGGTSKSGKGSNQDRKLICEDCRESFIFDVGEQRFFKSKGFTDPKRCPRCRKKLRVRLNKKKRRGGSRNNSQNRRNNHYSVVDGDSPYFDER